MQGTGCRDYLDDRSTSSCLHPITQSRATQSRAILQVPPPNLSPRPPTSPPLGSRAQGVSGLERGNVLGTTQSLAILQVPTPPPSGERFQGSALNHIGGLRVHG